MMRLFLFNIIFIVIAATYNIALAHSGWETRLPNGSYIKTGAKTKCQICHEYANPLTDPVTRNPFGSDFQAAGSAWNQTLGTKDSDVDGFSNAAELMCYNYAWVSGPCGSDQDRVANPGDYFIQPGPAVEKGVLSRKGDWLTVAPNPFNTGTVIRFSLSEPVRVSPAAMQIISASGKVVRTLPVRGSVGRVAWQGVDGNGKAVPSGLYAARMIAGKKTLTARLVLIR